MQWIETKITFSSDDISLSVDLIADIFYSLNTKGVVIDDPCLEPEESWAPDAVERPHHPAVTGYLPADGRYEQQRHDLEQSLSWLVHTHPIDYAVEYKQIDEEDWAESWKAYFKPEKITSRIVVKPTWCEYKSDRDQLVIEIDPGMAFGTGTHPTTALCIQLLEKHMKRGDEVLDVGTGSGILLIAAAKLGASRLTGIDLDPMAVDVARRNLDQNSIDPKMVELMSGDLVRDVTATYDLVVANILAEVIIELLDDVTAIVKPGSFLICSGIIVPSKSSVEEKMALLGFDIVETQQDGDWVAVVGKQSKSRFDDSG